MLPLDFYRILGVSPQANPQEIQRAYWEKMVKSRMHPDLGGDQEQAIVLNGAYETLMDQQKRKEYDLFLKNLTLLQNTMPIALPKGGIDGFKKIQCKSCESVYTLALKSSKKTLPEFFSCLVCGQAIFIGERLHRQTRRTNLSKPIHLHLSNDKSPIPCVLLDFSPHGCRLSCPRRLDSSVNVRLSCDEFEAEGEVVWLSHERQTYQAGVRFSQYKALAPSAVLDTLA